MFFFVNVYSITVLSTASKATADLLSSMGAAAVHTTCYEQHTKIMGLKVGYMYVYPCYCKVL